MSLFTVTIGTDTFEVYGGATACASYLNGKIGDGPTAFRAAIADDKSRLLVTASLFLDAQRWKGEPTTPAVGGTTLAWPRAGVTDEDGASVDSATVPLLLVRAVFELVALLADDSTIDTAADQGSNLKAMGAGSGRLEFFVPTTAQDGSAPALPPAVERLVAQYLDAPGGSVGGGIASGTDGCSDFAHRGRFDRSWPF